MQLPGIIVGFVAVCGGIVLLSGKTITIPKSFLSSLGGVSQMNSISGPTAGADGYSSDFRGRSYPGSSTLYAGEAPLDYMALVSGFDPATDGTMPSGLRQVAPPESCQPTPPGAGATVVSVILEGSNRKSTVQLLNRDLMAELALSRLRRYKQSAGDAGHDEPGAFAGQISLGAVDVLVTDTTGPVYLILQTSSNALWNVTVAQGVRIERIVAIGGGPVAVADPGPDVPVEIIGNMAEDCAAFPNRPIDGDWQIVRNEEEHGVSFDHAKFEGPHKAYAKWFKRAFGQPFDAGAPTAQDAGFVLLGPPPSGPPESRPVWTGVAGRELLFSGSKDLVALASLDDFDARVHEMQTQLIEEAIGGPIESLDPVVEEQVSQ